VINRPVAKWHNLYIGQITGMVLCEQVIKKRVAIFFFISAYSLYERNQSNNNQCRGLIRITNMRKYYDNYHNSKEKVESHGDLLAGNYVYVSLALCLMSQY